MTDDSDEPQNTITRLPLIPPVQALYDLAQKKGVLPGTGRDLFGKMERVLLFAAIDPESYTAYANSMLGRAGVPKSCRLYDHSAVLKMVVKIAGSHTAAK